MRRLLTVGLPVSAATALLLAAAMEVAFLASPAAGYCPLHGGELDFCLFAPSGNATFTIWVALGLAMASVVSCVFAWRGRLGNAAAFAAPGLIVVVVGLVLLVGHTTASREPINTPPPDYRFYESGISAALVGLVLLSSACCAQLAFRYRRVHQPGR